MEGDYLELSQIPYNLHLFPYNSHQSPLGTIGFLTEIPPQTVSLFMLVSLICA